MKSNVFFNINDNIIHSFSKSMDFNGRPYYIYYKAIVCWPIFDAVFHENSSISNRDALLKSKVCLPYNGLLTWIPKLVVLKNLRFNSNKTSLSNIEYSYLPHLPLHSALWPKKNSYIWQLTLHRSNTKAGYLNVVSNTDMENGKFASIFVWRTGPMCVSFSER